MTNPTANPPLPRTFPNQDEVDLAAHFRTIRRQTVKLCEPLEIDDYVIQSMADASPVKWHLAHTTWFLETFVLKPLRPDYAVYHPQFNYLFNSYYNAVGTRWARPQRGLLSRPTVKEVFQYRAYVDQQIDKSWPLIEPQGKVAGNLLMGLHHEQQHQELILTDLKHAWSRNPLHPIYQAPLACIGDRPSFQWQTYSENVVWIGHEGAGFAFDNESPRHRVFVLGFQLANRLVTNGDFLHFLKDGGYERPEYWLSDGWSVRQAQDWTAPLYWEKQGNSWSVTTLAGLQPLREEEPVCHISFYEADAFARWTGARLPTEAEWENAAQGLTRDGHFLESGRFHPAACPSPEDHGPLYQMFGDVWQWTASPYVAYPGYHPPAGALGEYNGKFMCNQMVLRGASCVTPRSHARPTYRNFFPPEARWQFAGLRLAKDLS